MQQSFDKNTAHTYLLNQWVDALEKGNVQRAIEIEFAHYNQLVKPGEDVSLWDKWQVDTLKFRKTITEKFDKKLPLRANYDQGKPFLIVHHNYSGLAHESQLARNLNFLREQGIPLNFEVAYLFGGDKSARDGAATLYKIEASAVGFLNATSYSDAGKRLEALTCSRGYCTVIYPSIFQMAYWMSLFVSHGNQKFLQMKYFPLHAGRLSAWGCGRKNSSGTFRVKGCDFTQLSVLSLSQANVQSTASPPTDLADSQGTIYFGSISRPEKVGDYTYNQFVIDMLNMHPATTYLYAGRKDNLGHIPSIVRSHPRARAIGWVNPQTIIKKYHIYLESFPWGGGDMSLLALENETPYLILNTPVNKVVGIYDFLSVISLSASPLLQFSFCDSVSTLANRFSELVLNPDLRRALGIAWSEAIRNYHPSDVHAWLSFLEN